MPLTEHPEYGLVLIGVLTLALAYVLLPRAYLQHQKRRLARLCRQRNAIAITFDDGPGRLLTLSVVQRLQQAQVPATFFLLGRNVRGNEDLVDVIRDRGHEIGSHGDEHVHHVYTLPWTGIVDTWQAWRRLRELTGRDAHTIAFRPPYGKLNLLSLAYVLWHRTPVVMWTHDSYDTRLGADLQPKALAEQLRKAGGGVVLLHDFDRSIADADKRVLAKLEAVLDLQKEGYKFLRVSELLSLPPAPAVR